MILLRKYKPEDFAIKDAIEPFCTPLDEIGLNDRGVAITGTDGDARACAGVVYTSDTEGYIWLKMSCKCKEKTYEWARTLKEGFKIMINSVDIDVYTWILDGFTQGIRLARALDMKKTGETKMFNDRKYIKYVVV